MKKLIFTILFLSFITAGSFAQRVLINQDFESVVIVNTDSLPAGWYKVSVDPTSGPGQDWKVRDTSERYVHANVLAVMPHAHSGIHALTIPWSAGYSTNLADDWCFTDSLRIRTGDSLIFWMLIGSIPGVTAYLDSMQVWVTSDQDPNLGIQKLATIRSNDSLGTPLANNEYTIHQFDLSAFNNQLVYIAFRYYMDVSQDGLWCNIDDVFIGNRASVGINQISTNVPRNFDLKQNYPNPFNPTTNIRFDLAKNTNVKLTIYNSLGQEVKVLVNGFKNAGSYEASFNASTLSSGTYFYRLTTDNFVDTKRMVLVK